MKRWRREVLITSTAFLIIGLGLAPVIPGNALMWHIVMLTGALFGFATVIAVSSLLGQIAATAMIAASIIRSFGFFIGMIAPRANLSNSEKLAAAVVWMLLAYEIGSVWAKVIIPGIKLEQLERFERAANDDRSE